MKHQPVLYQEIIHALRPHSPGRYVDGTVGAGGHARGILEACSPDGQLLGLDLDPQALALARETLAPFGRRAVLAQASYTTLPEQLTRLGWDSVDGIVLDLGLSSMQLESPERGFSFQSDAPLDMRFSPEQSLTASDIVNSYPEQELADLIWRNGQERHSRAIARRIVKERPLSTTLDLAHAVRRAVGGGGRLRIHPATRTFQAIRIAVNDELENLTVALDQALSLLGHGGRLVVISYHSLEDTIVKGFMRREARDCVCPPETPVCICGHKATLRPVTRGALRPHAGEVTVNPRSRSARLRAAERL